MRVKAAWLLAVFYVVCIVSPALSFAFGAERNASCVVEENHLSGGAYIDLARADSVHHVRTAHQSSPQANLEIRSASFDTVGEASEVIPGSDDTRKHRGSQCCGLSCVSALPAALAEVGQPAVPPMKRSAAVMRVLADKAPKPLHRPPIA